MRLPLVRPLVFAAAMAVISCSGKPAPALLENHNPDSPEIRGLQRMDPDQAYVPGAVEKFRAVYDSKEPVTLSWSASAGEIQADGDQVSWKLPQAESASLTLKLQTSSGREVSQDFNFSLAPSSAATIDSSSDETGDACDLAFDPSGSPRIAYHDRTHPSIWLASWNGSAWTTELVDGMGFNVGGDVGSEVELTVDSSGNPHIVYFRDYHVWYATKSGGTWTLERVDPDSALAYGTQLGIILDAVNGNRPTVLYTSNVNNVALPTVAYRSSPGSWTVSRQTVSTTKGFADFAGGLAQATDGTIYFSYSYSYYDNGNVDRLSIASLKSGTLTSLDGILANDYYSYPFAPVALDASSTPLVLAHWNILQVPLPFNLKTILKSSYEMNDVGLYDLATVGGKPVIAESHSSQLEIVTPDARGYWTYTHAGAISNSSHIGLAVDGSGSPHVCYQLGSTVAYH